MCERVSVNTQLEKYLGRFSVHPRRVAKPNNFILVIQRISTATQKLRSSASFVINKEVRSAGDKFSCVNIRSQSFIGASSYF